MNTRDLTSIEKRHLIEKYQSDARLLEHQLSKLHEWIQELEGQKVTPTTAIEDEVPAKEVKAVVEKPKKVVEEKTKTPGKRGPKPKVAVIEAAVSKEVVEKKAPKAAAEEKPKAVKGKKAQEKAATEKIKIGKAAKAAKPAVAKKETKTEKVAAVADSSVEKKKPGRQASLSFWDNFVLAKLKEINKPMAVTDLLEAMKDERDAQKLKEGNTLLGQLLNRSLHKLYHKMQLIGREAYDGRGYLYKTLGN